MAEQVTKIDIFSGFLGAGKTTLIKKLIKEAFQGEKIVLIENEFGEIGIDGGFMREAGIQVNELNSGCICCSLVGDFREALKKVVETYHPDRILIEPSGVGKLSDVTRAVEGVGETLPVSLNSFVTVADVNKVKMYMKNFGEFYDDQVSHASCIILSRTGNASEEKIAAAVALLAEKNPTADVDGHDACRKICILASLAFGIIIAETIHELGVTDDKRVAFEISRSGVIAGVLMAIIYCGLGLAGMQLGTVMPDATNGAAILARSASMHFGLAGTVVVFAIFFLACMNVCIGLISCCSRYFCETYVVEGGAEASEEAMRRPFAVLAFVFAAFSCVLSNVGLDVILMFSVPMLNALYPVAIVLVLMGLVHGFCDAHPQVWIWVGGVVAVQSVITSVRDAFFAGAWLPFDALPLADIGAAWAPVAVVAFVIGLLHSRFVAHSRS